MVSLMDCLQPTTMVEVARDIHSAVQVQEPSTPVLTIYEELLARLAELGYEWREYSPDAEYDDFSRVLVFDAPECEKDLSW